MRPSETRLEELKISIIIRSARSALGISQGDLALELNASQSAIARLERGTGTISANVLLRAIRFFSSYGIDINGILEDDPQIKFSERFFRELVDKENSQSENLVNSDVKRRSGKTSKALPK
jgi:transcriptional regulator with XRE-family HTH domain|tara:strand:- start:236 stop:598 length:363 start_codon:yes stop_codon:yes gene_type:complete